MIVPNVNKIAVLRASSLGDYMFVLPALDAIRQTYPDAEIVLLGQSWQARFLDRRPGPVDRVMPVPFLKGVCEEQYGAPAGKGQVENFIADGVAEEFDIAFQMHGGGKDANPFIHSLKPRLSVGLKAPDAPPLDRWIPYTVYHPDVLRFLEVAALAGAEVSSLEPHLAVLPEDIAEAEACAGGFDRPLAVLHPGSIDPRRRWPAERFAALGDILSCRGMRVAVTGRPDERALAERVVAGMEKPALNLCGRLSLKGLTGLCALGSLVIANDTGPLYLARAVGTPTIGIYWVGHVINAGPLTSAMHRAHISWPTVCGECGADCIETSCRHRSSLVDRVSVEEVAASAEILAGAPQGIPVGIAPGKDSEADAKDNRAFVH